MTTRRSSPSRARRTRAARRSQRRGQPSVEGEHEEGTAARAGHSSRRSPVRPRRPDHDQRREGDELNMPKLGVSFGTRRRDREPAYGAFMECHEGRPPRRRHSPVMNPIGKEARGEVCRTRLRVSDGAVVRTRGRCARRRGSDSCQSRRTRSAMSRPSRCANGRSSSMVGRSRERERRQPPPHHGQGGRAVAVGRRSEHSSA
jgi:hypothetical protein